MCLNRYTIKRIQTESEKHKDLKLSGGLIFPPEIYIDQGICDTMDLHTAAFPSTN